MVLCIVVVVLGPVLHLKRSTLARQFAVGIISSMVAGSILPNTWFGKPQLAPPVPQVMTEPLQNVTAAEPRRPTTVRPLRTDVLRQNEPPEAVEPLRLTAPQPRQPTARPRQLVSLTDVLRQNEPPGALEPLRLTGLTDVLRQNEPPGALELRLTAPEPRQ